MKKLVLVSSYCDTTEKLDLLKYNVHKLKSLGLDVFIISPIKIDVECDFLFITKENPILTHGNKQISWWSVKPFHEKKVKLIRHVEDYGWASLFQIKKIMEFARTMQYDIFYLMIYDINITEKIEAEFLNRNTNLIFPRTDFSTKSKVYPYSFHLAIFDKEMLGRMSEKIDYDDYCWNDGFAEDFIEKWSKDLNLPTSDIVVEDLINTSPKIDYFNYSQNAKYRLFISKDERTPFTVFVYECLEPIRITLNDQTFEVRDNFDLIQLDYDFEPKAILIENSDSLIDYLPTYHKILNNQIQIFSE